MSKGIDFKKQKTSWTKYDIVQTIDVIYSVDTIYKYKNKQLKIDEPILKSFLGIESLTDPIPEYWITIQDFPNEKKLFALLAAIFTHGGVVESFANIYSKGNMKGVFVIDTNSKVETNIRSALVESGAAKPFYRREKKVHYDLSKIFYNLEVGPLFKEVLKERLSRLAKKQIDENDFYEICYSNLFHKALGLTQKQFYTWLEGVPFKVSYIKNLHIENFFCIREPLDLDFKSSKEIYFLGENGDGKTLFLMALCLAFKGNYIIEKTEKEKTGKAEDILNKYPGSLVGKDDSKRVYTSQNAIYLENLFGYGTHRGRASGDSPEQYGFMTLFDNDLTLQHPVSWLKDLRLREEEEDGKETGLAISHLEKVLYELLEKRVKVVFRGSEVVFEEKGYELTLDQLSEGYRSILIFVCDLLYRLLPKGSKWNKNTFLQKGVVLVDEIDQHLHPRWQRVIIRNLRNLFPNIQFFLTTHSPTIIQGASEDAIIYRVYREEGNTKISEPYYRKELDHLMMNTLVTSSLFGLDDARLDPDNDQAVTDDDFLAYRVNHLIEQRINEEKNSGKIYFTEQQIDDLINNAINKEIEDEED